MVAPAIWYTDRGIKIELSQEGYTRVQALMRESVWRCCYRQAYLDKPEIGDALETEAQERLKHLSAIHALHTGDMWTQQNLWKNGGAISPSCPACHQAVGDQAHRSLDCPLWAGCRNGRKSDI
eukprot:882981-Amphidinium_carterae.2